ANQPIVEDFVEEAGHEYLVRTSTGSDKTPKLGPGIDPYGPDGDQALPHLAEDWEVSDDALTYTFTLRRGVHFHNTPPVSGREMDIEDWRTSLETFMEIGFNRAPFLE